VHVPEIVCGVQGKAAIQLERRVGARRTVAALECECKPLEPLEGLLMLDALARCLRR
jgi:hypothetical protein